MFLKCSCCSCCCFLLCSASSVVLVVLVLFIPFVLLCMVCRVFSSLFAVGLWGWAQRHIATASAFRHTASAAWHGIQSATPNARNAISLTPIFNNAFPQNALHNALAQPWILQPQILLFKSNSDLFHNRKHEKEKTRQCYRATESDFIQLASSQSFFFPWGIYNTMVLELVNFQQLNLDDKFLLCQQGSEKSNPWWSPNVPWALGNTWHINKTSTCARSKNVNVAILRKWMVSGSLSGKQTTKFEHLPCTAWNQASLGGMLSASSAACERSAWCQRQIKVPPRRGGLRSPSGGLSKWSTWLGIPIYCKSL